MKTYKQFIEESIIPLAPLAYEGGKELPEPDRKSLKNIQAMLNKDNLKRKGAIRPTTTPTTSNTQRTRTTDLEKVDIREARAEDKRGLPPTGKNRTKQKLHRKGSTAYSGGQNPHLRGTENSTKAQRRENNRSRYLDHPKGKYDTIENRDKYLDMQKEKRTSPYNSRFD